MSAYEHSVATEEVNFVSVGFPWRPGCPHRDAAAGWVMGQWARHHPDIQLAHTGGLPAEGPWRKAVHVDHLARTSTAEVLVVSDVDVWVAPSAVRAAIAAVAGGDAEWAVPHGDVHRLCEDATRVALTLDDADGMQPLGEVDLAEPPYPGHPGGGLVVIRRDLALQVPMDPRFEGWGQEDDSWALALTTLAGKPWRGRAPLVHLWHPAPPRKTRHRGNQLGMNLHHRYQAATAGTPGPMRTLVAEARTLLDAG
jgi:hypothetical protein